MAVRLRYNLGAAVSSTTAEEKDLGNVSYEVATDDLGEGGTRKTFLPSGATDVSLDMGNVADAKYVAIRTNARDPTEPPGQIDVKLNSLVAVPLEIVPLGSEAEGHFMLTTTGLTDLFASNPGTVDMEIIITLAGD
jgi:hypothetical protein